jgi:hypothetical protein
MHYYEAVGTSVNAVEAMEKAIARLARYEPSKTLLEVANLFPAAQRNLDFRVIAEDVLEAMKSWQAALQNTKPAKPQKTRLPRNMKKRTKSR